MLTCTGCKLGEDARPLIADPDCVTLKHIPGKGIPPLLIRDIGQNRSVKDDDGCIGRCLSDQRRQILRQISGHKTRRATLCDRNRGLQPIKAQLMFGPDQLFQPGHISIATDVKRVQIQPNPPDDIRVSHRSWCAR